MKQKKESAKKKETIITERIDLYETAMNFATILMGILIATNYNAMDITEIGVLWLILRTAMNAIREPIVRNVVEIEKIEEK